MINRRPRKINQSCRTTPDQLPLTHPYVKSDLPGPHSADLLTRQQHRESNARTYPKNFPIAIEDRFGTFVRDVDGIFIDFLSGVGVLSLGNSRLELRAIVSEQVSQLTHCLDFPTPAKVIFTDAQFSIVSLASVFLAVLS
jgi:diaminobutyrate-2-oxoglutarate transaminase